MKTLLFRASLVVITVVAVLPAAAVPPPAPKQSVPNPLAPRFKQVRDRIDALFFHRNGTPTDETRPNPFRVPALPAAAPAGTTPLAGPAAAPAPMDDLALLQKAAASFKVSGVFEIGGRSHLVINARPYKQGDVVPTSVLGEKAYIRVREISKRSVTLVLNEAEMTLKF